MIYLLDANVFIEAKNRYYRFGFCPAFWEWIERAHDRGTVYSVRKVRDQLLERRDELFSWVKEVAFVILLGNRPGCKSWPLAGQHLG